MEQQTPRTAAQNDPLYSMLLESGTNELEIMEFTVGRESYGINVAKVREIIKLVDITPLPSSTPSLPGVIKVREEIIPVIDLATYLSLSVDEERDKERDLFIITYFNQTTVAFLVHKVHYISRFSWDQIENMSGTGHELTAKGVVVGVAKASDRMILILDYEKILSDLYPSASITAMSLDAIEQRPMVHGVPPVMIAEDSEFLRAALLQAIGKAGRADTLVATHGQEAWDMLQGFKALKDGGSILDHVSLLISDIEMPQMDGQRLLRLVKEDDYLKDLPVVMFSSLISESMNEKCRDLGAVDMISKPEIGRLVDVIVQYGGERNS